MSEDGGNGKIQPKPVKTEEQLKQERIDRFNKDPETFVEISELICGVVRNTNAPLGMSIFVGDARRSEIDIAQVELNHRINLIRRGMDAPSKIQPAKGSMLNFVRKTLWR